VLAFAVGASLPAAANGPGGPDRGYHPSFWQGLYAGVHAGFGDAGGSLDGFIAGAQIGYNWQRGLIVYGWEADATWSDISESASACVVGVGCAKAEVSIDWMATVRGRLGYLVQPNLLAYTTAGLGIVGFSSSQSVSVPGLSGSGSFDDTDTGFVIGFGIEGKYNETTTWRIEYLDVDDIDVIRAGLNFKIGGY
jgi:outer membrane immunogenic protein